MKKRPKYFAQASALQITNAVAVISISVILLTFGFDADPAAQQSEVAGIWDSAAAVSPCYSIADTSQPEIAVSSAFDGTNFLVALRGNAASSDVAGAQFLSPAGSRVGGFINSGRTMDGFFDGPRVAFGGSNYLMVWTDAASQHPASGNDVYARFISPAGSLVGAAFPVSEASGNQAACGVAFDGTNFLVIWSAADGLHGRRLSSTGTLLPGALFFTADDPHGQAAVAYGGGQYLVVWIEGPVDGEHAAKGRTVSASGQLGNVLLLSQNDSYQYNPISVAYGAGRFMVVWHRNADEDAEWNLFGRIVLPDGTLASGELTVSASPMDEIAWANNVLFDGQDFIVVWTQGDRYFTTSAVVWAQYWTTSGATNGSPFVIDNTGPSRLGLGLSGTDGRVLTVIDTAFTTSAAGDVCARLISRPTPINISGAISYCSNPVPGPVPNVTLTLTGSALGSTLSDASGNYAFLSLASGGNYTVIPTKAARVPGSPNINTVDVIATQRHFLNLGTPLSGCRLTAADVSGDTSINTVDVIAIQRFFSA